MIRRIRLAARYGPRLLAVGMAVLPAAGCSKGPNRVHMSGQILYDGKPVPVGEVYFDPDIAKGVDGPQGFARIKDGRYDTRDAGVSMTPGPHVVRMFGFDGQARPNEELSFGARLFGEYSTTADVPAGGGVADFQVSAPRRGP